ncbi:hypothetical protein C1H46_033793 [Malus baccata]|uniref:Uncharacterized protein n=1 Tax=Malus baccata TaxID=106549 RepID=A0A540L2A0_MALBA|nr:hypothetical protein C1H46_033793 [Malus baccata]
MDEIAYGLEMAGCRFIWGVRSNTWGPDEGWERRVEGRGLVVRDWEELSDGELVSGSPTTGLANGSRAEQPLNAKYVATGLKAEPMVKPEKITTVDRYVICDGVKELMEGEKGRTMERAGVQGTMARRAVEKGGSSDTKLDELIKCLIANQKEIKF